MALAAEEQQSAVAGPSNTTRSDSEGSQGSGPKNTIDDSMINPVLTAQSRHRIRTQHFVRSTRSTTCLNSPEHRSAFDLDGRHVVLIDTPGSDDTNLRDPEIDAEREVELMTKGISFKSVLDRGGQMARHDSTASSVQDILHRILRNHPVPLQIQEELVDERKGSARVQSTASASPEPPSGVGGFHARLPSLGSSGQPAFSQSSLIQQSSTRSSIIQPLTTTFGQTVNIQAYATSSSRETCVPSSSGLSISGFTQYQSQTLSFLPPSAQLPPSLIRTDIITVGFVDSQSVGCIALDIILYLSLIFITGVVGIRDDLVNRLTSLQGMCAMCGKKYRAHRGWLISIYISVRQGLFSSLLSRSPLISLTMPTDIDPSTLNLTPHELSKMSKKELANHLANLQGMYDIRTKKYGTCSNDPFARTSSC